MLKMIFKKKNNNWILIAGHVTAEGLGELVLTKLLKKQQHKNRCAVSCRECDL